MFELAIKNSDELVPGDLIILVDHHNALGLVISISEKAEKSPWIRMYYTYDCILDSHLIHAHLKFYVLT